MARAKGAPTAPKVECRFRSGPGPYSRGGETWSSDFRPVPDELLRDDDKMKLLAEDPHLEIKVDGVFVSGPRAKTKDVAAPPAMPAAIEEQLDELRERLDESDEALAKAQADLDGLRTTTKAKSDADEATIADLKKQLEALKGATAASGTTPATPASDPTADASKPKPKP